MSGGNGRQTPGVPTGNNVAISASQKPGTPLRQSVSQTISDTTSIAAKKRRLLNQLDWTGVAVQKPLLINYPKPSKKLQESHASHNLRKIPSHGRNMTHLTSQPDNIRLRLSRLQHADSKLPAKSSSLSNLSSCSQSVRHKLCSDQSCSTNSSLPRVGTSPRTIIHPQPIRATTSSLFQRWSPSPEQLESLMGQKGSETTIEETDDLLTQSTRMYPTRCSSRLSHMSCEPASSPKRNKSHKRGDSRSETSCSPRIGRDPASPPPPSSCITSQRQRLPDLSHTLLRDTSSGPQLGSPVTGAGVCGGQTLAVARGLAIRQPPPATDIIGTMDSDASLSLSQELPADIDPQELLDFLQEFEQDRRRPKKAAKTGLGSQPSAAPRDKHMPRRRLSDGTKGHGHGKRAGGSTASDMAPPRPPSNQKYHPIQCVASPDDRLQQTPALSANDSILSLVVHPPDSPPAMPQSASSRYRPPELFIGRFASGLATNPRVGKKRRGRPARPDIRALPDYDDDPIDE
ncbi:hypothetical protein E4U42_003152 [Claviceps africana]|uniref:Uncharacterized protein n=1 Tax=Claviceps africana TaxID=83212 RepID=A0A8K0J780_9HYPO|nr:hypothetical protein E4U42_003152 [Claviceps africana]